MGGPYCDAIPTKPGILVILPSGASMISTHTAMLTLPNLQEKAHQECHLFPGLATGSLISIGQLCDHGCEALFNAYLQQEHQLRTPDFG